MMDNRPTYDIADPLIGKFVQPIASGDIVKPFPPDTRDEDGRLLSLFDDHLSGKHLVLVLLNNPRQEAVVTVLKAFAERRRDFQDRNTAVLAVHSSSNAAVNQKLKLESGFRWPILGDSSGVIHAQYGLHKNHGETVRIVLLTRYRQIRCWYDSPVDLNLTLETVMTQITTPLLQENEQWYPLHAPILIVPNVFTREECRNIVESFESHGDFHVASGQNPDTSADFKIPVYEHNRQDRVDHIIRDQAMTQFIDQRLGQRVNPMIKKAFAFEVTRREDLHIARYVGERGGIQMGHRDNTSASTAYRRFAFSMNLNDSYEGGGIVFKEFSDHPYRAEPGTVIIFSSSLLHEVQETTHGTRYSLITHLFNDAAVQNRA